MKYDSKGFTLIELLIVVVIIGALAVIAVPKFGSARKKAYVAQMQSSLRTLVSAQESYFSEVYIYADDVSRLEFTETSNVSISILKVSANGWSAKATHASVPNVCGVYIGPVPPPPVPGSEEGVVACTD